MGKNGFISLSTLMRTAREHREDVLKAETGALLHDTGKLVETIFSGVDSRDVYMIGDETLSLLKEFLLTDEVLARMSNKKEVTEEMRKRTGDELDKYHRASLLSNYEPAGNFFRQVSFSGLPDKSGATMTLEELAAFGRYYTYASADEAAKVIGSKIWAAEMLGISHSLAHMEKQEVDDTFSQSAKSGPVYLASPFGNHFKKRINLEKREKKNDTSAPSLDEAREKVFTAASSYVNNALSGNNPNMEVIWKERKAFLIEIKNKLQHALADTRVLLNEVSLWDWGYTAAFLFKPLLAYGYCRAADMQTNKMQPPLFMDIWPGYAVLRINLDRSKLLSRAIRLPDIAYFSNAVEQAFDRVKMLLEVESPVACEIFRDDKGIYFLLPGSVDLDKQAVDSLVRCISSVDNLFPLLLDVQLEAVKGTTLEEIKSSQDKNDCADFSSRRESYKRHLQEHLNNFFVAIMTGGRAAAVQPGGCLQNIAALTNIQGGGSLTCPVCRVRLRPARGNVQTCLVCRKNRSSAARFDASFNPSLPPFSPWSDEISGRDRRTALLSIYLPLGWLVDEGECLFLPKPPKGKKNNRPQLETTIKNMTPTRLSRMRATIEDFLHELLNSFIAVKREGSWRNELRCMRLVLTPAGDTAVAELDEEDEILLVNSMNRWEIPLEKVNNEFSTTDNLLRFAHAGKKGEEMLLQALLLLAKEGLSPGDHTWQVLAKDKRKAFSGHFKGKVEKYLPCRIVYRDSLRLTVMLPSVDVPSFVEKAFSAYKREFSQVQNRLPLKIGAVFLRDRTPVGAALEAVNRWFGNLEQKKGRENKVEVLAVDEEAGYPLTDAPADITKELRSSRITVQLPRLGPARFIMAANFAFSGKGNIQLVPDSFYPRWQCGDRLIPTDELAAGSSIFCSPSTFSYLVLDSVAERFESMEERTILLDDFIYLYRTCRQLKEQQRGFALRVMRSYQLLESKAASLNLFYDARRDLELLQGVKGEVFLKLAAAVFQQERFRKADDRQEIIFAQSLPGSSDKLLRYDWFVFMHDLFLKVIKEEDQELLTEVLA